MRFRVLFQAFEYLTFIMAVCMLSAGLMGLYVKMFNYSPPFPTQALHLPIMMCMAVILVVRLRETVFGVVSLIPYVLLGLLAVASYKWSIKSTLTLFEGVTSLLTVMYLGYIAWRYNWSQIVNGIWISMLGMAIVSLILFVAVPDIGRSTLTHAGTLSGIWVEKNAAGQIGAFGALVALARMAISPKTIVSSFISFLIFTLFLLLSTSKTSLVAYIIGCAGFAWVFLMRRNRVVSMTTLWVTLIGGFTLTNWIRGNTEAVLGMLGRSSTFTGRADIWKALEISLAERPMLGHGYGAFWDEDNMGTTLSYVLDDLKYMPNHSHNSILEMKINLGMVGVSLLVGGMVFYALITLLKVRKDHGAYFAVPFTLAAIIVGSFESVLAHPGNYAGAMFILVGAKMVRPETYTEAQSALRNFIYWMGQRAQENERARRPYTQRTRYRPRPTYPRGLPTAPPLQLRRAGPNFQSPRPYPPPRRY